MKLLGIDYGREKIGLAIGDTETRFAGPLKVLSKNSIPSIKNLIKEAGVEIVVVGVPQGKMDEEIKIFGQKLQKQTAVTVEYFDETLTTKDAQKILLQIGMTRKRRRQLEDAFAAAIMLQYYLDTRHC